MDRDKQFILFAGGILLVAAAVLDEKTRNSAMSLINGDISFKDFTTNLTTSYSAPNLTTALNKELSGKDILARTIWGEARSEGYAGMQAVASVILNRYKMGQKSAAVAKRFGSTIEEICLKPYQFSAWLEGDPSRDKMLKVTDADPQFKSALEIAGKAVRLELPDNTGGADHYLNIKVTKQIRGGTLPSWADLKKTTASIGEHTFLKLA